MKGLLWVVIALLHMGSWGKYQSSINSRISYSIINSYILVSAHVVLG